MAQTTHERIREPRGPIHWAKSSAVAPETREPMVTTWKAMTSVSPESFGRKKSERHRWRSRRKVRKSMATPRMKPAPKNA